mmetsp:Transcript_12219/g.44583  ORF Transcript_12219/g.44583 Transcript_12219/m.44583 type:complete len:150 (-) Transcript_12219:541-990(-)
MPCWLISLTYQILQYPLFLRFKQAEQQAVELVFIHCHTTLYCPHACHNLQSSAEDRPSSPRLQLVLAPARNREHRYPRTCSLGHPETTFRTRFPFWTPGTTAGNGRLAMGALDSTCSCRVFAVDFAHLSFKRLRYCSVFASFGCATSAA